MHIGLLFYSDTLAMTESSGQIKGRAVANHGFVKALLENKKNHQVTFFVSSPEEATLVEGFFLSNKKHENVLVIPFWEMTRELNKNPIDVLHVLGPDLYRGLSIRNASDKNFAVTGVTHSLGHAPFLDWLILNLLSRPQAHDCLVTTTPTAETVVKSMTDSVGKLTGQNTTLATKVIPLGINTSEFDAPASTLRGELKIAENEIVLVSVNRFSYTTKVDLIPLLMTLRALNKNASQKTKLILAGAGGDEKYPQILAEAATELGVKNEVIFEINPGDSRKKQILKAADIYVALGDNPQETFGLSVIEGLASGLPVIASHWDGYASLVEDGHNGYLIPTTAAAENKILSQTSGVQIDSLNHLLFSQTVATDLEILSQKIKLLSQDKSLRHKMGLSAKESSEKYDWGQVISSYFLLWETLSKQTPSKTEASFLDYTKNFSSYSKNKLSVADTFELSEAGLDLLKGTFPLRVYSSIENLFDFDATKKLLLTLQNKTSFADLQKAFTSSKAGFECTHTVLWLYKYGLIKKVV